MVENGQCILYGELYNILKFCEIKKKTNILVELKKIMMQPMLEQYTN